MKHFFIVIQAKMSDQEKKRRRIYDLLNAETKPNLSEKNGLFYNLYQAQTWILLIMLYGVF